MRLTAIFSALFLSFLSFSSLSAQNMEAGLGLGVQTYQGDLAGPNIEILKQLQPTINLFGRYHLSEKWAVRGQLGFGKLYADESRFGTNPERIERGFSFQTSIFELAILPEWRPLSIGNVQLYAFSGISALIFNARPNFNEKANSDNLNIVVDKNATYPKTTVALPIGGGLQWFPNETFAIGLEASGRATLTDFLDGFNKSANPNSNDHLIMATVTVSKFFGGGKRQTGGNSFGKKQNVGCPTFR